MSKLSTIAQLLAMLIFVLVLMRLELFREPTTGTWWPVKPPAVLVQLGRQILAELAPDSSDDPLLLIASPSFQTFCRLCNEYTDLMQYMDLDEFLDEYECNLR